MVARQTSARLWAVAVEQQIEGMNLRTVEDRLPRVSTWETRVRPDPLPIGCKEMTYRDPVPQQPVVEQTEVVDDGYGKIRAVRAMCTVISAICTLFAVVLAIHILLVLGSANGGNGFAQFIASWSGAITLGLSDLFTPGDAKMQVLLQSGPGRDSLVDHRRGADRDYRPSRFACAGAADPLQADHIAGRDFPHAPRRIRSARSRHASHRQL
ncbi:hypothetical protein [Fodinicola feengrottensis]|uniref:hypothetical protein n=1 Tax=Fodinicola feengrottensis TaxID=435914 RepID=UPI002442103F|nr:hypothetical protein [Fodinicola feengrottensis]